MFETAGRSRWGRAGERIVDWLRVPSVRRAVLVTAVLTGCFVWVMVVVGFSFALVERGARHWWLMLPFGLLVPLVALAAVRAVPTVARSSSRPHGAVRPSAAPSVRHDGSAPAGETSVPPAGGDAAEAPATGPVPPDGSSRRLPVEPLSQRELQVLAQLAAGRSNREIANALYVAPGTVKAHLNRIFRKLEAASRLQAVLHARQAGLLDRVDDGINPR
ncbi:response regulator transcription factor [Plantactinospora sp. BB1]|uniref:helix-turn-helix transcriptional regulator n=1 Tax=Plantactinospora sp. BB1 TaxID=2071627 RepID=UPI001F31958B|nr:response regulator transcription factor [Plantactinospora sp. BB1]